MGQDFTQRHSKLPINQHYQRRNSLGYFRGHFNFKQAFRALCWR